MEDIYFHAFREVHEMYCTYNTKHMYCTLYEYVHPLFCGGQYMCKDPNLLHVQQLVIIYVWTHMDQYLRTLCDLETIHPSPSSGLFEPAQNFPRRVSVSVTTKRNVKRLPALKSYRENPWEGLRRLTDVVMLRLIRWNRCQFGRRRNDDLWLVLMGLWFGDGLVVLGLDWSCMFPCNVDCKRISVWKYGVWFRAFDHNSLWSSHRLRDFSLRRWVQEPNFFCIAFTTLDGDLKLIYNRRKFWLWMLAMKHHYRKDKYGIIFETFFLIFLAQENRKE